MNKIAKKIGTIFMATAMMVSLSSQAFAVTTPNSGTPPTVSLSANTFAIEKDIVLFNVDGSQIYEPNVTYSYSIAPATVPAGTDITGLKLGSTTETVTAAVRSGVAGGVKIKGNAASATYDTTANVIFGAGTNTLENTITEGTTVATTSAHVDENLNFEIYPSVIYANGANQAGIYRYVLTDTTTAATLTAAGITRDEDYVETLYLDVYTKYNATNDGLEVYGYVLFDGTQGTEFTYDSTATEVSKRSGYDVESEVDGGAIISDQYHTYNVEVTKAITGSLADVHHNFPFKVDLSNSQITSQPDFYYVVTTDGTAATATDAALSATGAWTLGTLATGSALSFENGDGILITGLPETSKVMVTELNDTVDMYTASAKDTDDNDMTLDNNDTAKVMAANNGQAAIATAFDIDNTTSKDNVDFTNTLDVISPTGLALRFAPYILMMIAGLALLFVSRKSTVGAETWKEM